MTKKSRHNLPAAAAVVVVAEKKPKVQINNPFPRWLLRILFNLHRPQCELMMWTVNRIIHLTKRSTVFFGISVLLISYLTNHYWLIVFAVQERLLLHVTLLSYTNTEGFIAIILYSLLLLFVALLVLFPPLIVILFVEDCSPDSTLGWILPKCILFAIAWAQWVFPDVCYKVVFALSSLALVFFFFKGGDKTSLILRLCFIAVFLFSPPTNIEEWRPS
jgi:hypothetical protein